MKKSTLKTVKALSRKLNVLPTNKVVKDKTKYSRKSKHRQVDDYDEPGINTDRRNIPEAD